MSDDNICYADGCICNPLDIVCVDVVRAAPFAHQSENYLIDSHKRWRKIRECSLAEILQVHPTDNFAYIYENTQPYIDGDTIKSIGYSLMLVSVSSLVIYKVRNSNNQQKTKASFIYNGQRYSNIAVTDPAYYAAQENVRLNGGWTNGGKDGGSWTKEINSRVTCSSGISNSYRLHGMNTESS